MKGLLSFVNQENDERVMIVNQENTMNHILSIKDNKLSLHVLRINSYVLHKIIKKQPKQNQRYEFLHIFPK